MGEGGGGGRGGWGGGGRGEKKEEAEEEEEEKEEEEEEQEEEEEKANLESILEIDASRTNWLAAVRFTGPRNGPNWWSLRKYHGQSRDQPMPSVVSTMERSTPSC